MKTWTLLIGRVKHAKLLMVAKWKEPVSILLTFAGIPVLTGVWRSDRSSGLSVLAVLPLNLVPQLPWPGTSAFKWLVLEVLT